MDTITMDKNHISRGQRRWYVPWRGSKWHIKSKEEETQVNANKPNFRKSGRDIKTPSPYETYFEGNQQGAQLFGMKTEDNVESTKNLKIIAANYIFDQ